jgi:IS605 OrfB family transposase
MKLVATVKLLPTPAQAASLLATMERFNAACDWLGERAFEAHTASKLDLQHAHYRDLRELYGLSAQMAVRCISKVSEAYKRDKGIRPRFKPHGAVPYDQRIMSFKAMDRVSLLLLDGRTLIPFVAGDYHRARLGENIKRGQADLVLRKGRWYLYVTVEIPDGAPIEPKEWLGVDLGIRNLATDSDGDRHSGDAVEAVRVRIHRLRGALQKAGSKSAKRHLRKLAGREAGFRKDVNHTIAKHLVRNAKDTGRGLALEDLSGIRDRTTVRKAQRAQFSGWSFHQLRAFVAYKAALAGVLLRFVDPRNTSRTCPECGHCDRRNRRSQSEFVCKSCGFAQHADVVGARNVARRAAVNRPIVSSVDRGNTETIHRVPRRAQGQAPAFMPG